DHTTSVPDAPRRRTVRAPNCITCSACPPHSIAGGRWSEVGESPTAPPGEQRAPGGTAGPHRTAHTVADPRTPAGRTRVRPAHGLPAIALSSSTSSRTYIRVGGIEPAPRRRD